MTITTATTAADSADAGMREQVKRAGYIDGLRCLADILEDDDAVPLPYHGDGTAITISAFLNAPDPRAALAAAARAFRGMTWRKDVRESEYGDYFDLEGELHGLKLVLTAYRDAVCERVVTGTREVTEMVKDPEALAAVPEVEVTRTVETVEWVCGSVLAPAAQEGPAAA